MTFQISRSRRQLQFAEPFPCDQHERDGSMKSSMSKREAKNWRHREDLLRIENFRNRSGERRDCPPNRKAFHLRCGKHAGGSQCGRQGEIYECGNRNGRPDTAQSIKDRSPGERSSRLFLCIPPFCIKRDRERTSNVLSRPQKFRTSGIIPSRPGAARGRSGSERLVRPGRSSSPRRGCARRCRR